MSTFTDALPHPDAPLGRSPGDGHPVVRLAQRATPDQGWVAFFLLLGAAQTVAWLVLDAHWVETPGLRWVVLISLVTGLLLARIRVPAVLLHPAGLALGVIVVTWQMTSLMESDSLAGQVQELGHRLRAWYVAATSGAISTDLVPLSTGIVGAAWLMGYLGSWFLFRSNNIWVALVLSGNAMITALSFLPGDLEFTSRFFLFVLLAMLLMVRISSIQRHQEWERERVSFRPSASWLTLHGAGWFIVLVLVVAAMLPLNAYLSNTLARAWNSTGRAPFAYFDEEFTRLFAGVPSWKDLTGRFFGATLPFHGSIAFNGGVVMVADSEIPTYWTTQTYSEYTSQGWKAGKTRKVEVSTDNIAPVQDSMKRERANQSVTLMFGATNLWVGGNLELVSEKTVLEALEPKEFQIDLLDPSNDAAFPEDVRQIAQRLRVDLRGRGDAFVESAISRRLPSDLVLLDVSRRKETDPDFGGVARVTLARKEPITQEIAAWRFARKTQRNMTYAMVSSVSVATQGDLRAASTEYSGFIRDHYLQLPQNLPARVRDKAAALTAGARSPLDKALLIQAHLRDPANFTYSWDIPAPPAGADGVDHFLFETRTGYSDFYASAMAVMLRTVGVPARLAGGYAPGADRTSGGSSVIRDTDSHVWVQVLFPGFGWIDFEPTPKWVGFDRGTPLLAGESDTSEDAPVGSGSATQSELDECLELSIEEAECFEDQPPAEDFSTEPTGGPQGDVMKLWVPVALGSLLGVLAIMSLAVWTAWRMGLRGLSKVEQVYTKMNRLGALAGVPRRSDQTPADYASSIGRAVPAVALAAQSVSWAYAAGRYGRRAPTPEVNAALEQAWSGLRAELIKRVFKRLRPGWVG